MRVRRSGVIAAALLTLAAVAGAIHVLRSETVDAFQALIAASAQRRPVTGRLAGFPHAPAPRRTRSVGIALDAGALQLHAAAERALASVAPGSHASAVSLLISGDLERSVALLERRAEDRGDAVAWNDLAAGRLELGLTSDDPSLLVSALGAADAALKISPQMPEALFNRALVLESLGIAPASSAALGRYLEVDASSAWAAEARQRMAQLTAVRTRTDEWSSQRTRLEQGIGVAEIVARFPEQSRRWAEVECLSRWAACLQNADEKGAARWLKLAGDIGASLDAVSGETLLRDSVAAITNSATRSQVADAHVTYRQARVLYATTTRKVAEAMPLFERSERLFRAAGSPMADVVAYYRANALFDAQQAAASASVLDDLERRAAPGYKSLLANILWLRGTIAASQGSAYEALRAYQAAADAFSVLREDENAARMHLAAVDALRWLGRSSEAYRAMPGVFRSASRSGKPSLWEQVLFAASRDELQDRRWAEAASLFQVELETAQVSPQLVFEAQLWKALAEARRAGRNTPDLHAARDAALASADPVLRADMVDSANFAEAFAVRPENPRRAMELLDSVVAYRVGSGRRGDLSRAYLERARAARALGDLASAERDLRAAIGAFEQAGPDVGDTELRDAFFGSRAEAWDELVQTLCDRQQLAAAVEAAESNRSRALTELAGRRDATSLGLDSICARLDPAVVLVHYTALERQTLISILERGRHRELLVPTGRAVLASLTAEMLDAIARDDRASIAKTAERLHEILIGPLGGKLNAGTTLAISADSTVASVPFAALRKPGGGYLAEDVPILVVPSAASYAAHATASPNVVDAAKRLAVIADPAFDLSAFGRLQRLGAARRDGEGIRRLFPNVESLSDAEATPRAVLAAIERADVVHIAAHAAADDRDADRSLIVLAPEGKKVGALYLREIAQQHFSRLQLVVLAGCRTASPGGGKASINSLARAFLAAGSEQAVAAAWDVDDTATSHLTETFYEELASGRTVSEALRVSQLTLIRSGDGELSAPRSWAAFQVIGYSR